MRYILIIFLPLRLLPDPLHLPTQLTFHSLPSFSLLPNKSQKQEKKLMRQKEAHQNITNPPPQKKSRVHFVLAPVSGHGTCP